MDLLFTGIFSAAALVFVAYPLLKSKKHLISPDGLYDSPKGKILSHVFSRKNMVENNIKDLELEHEMGKLSGADFESLRDQLLTELNKMIEEIKRLETPDGLDDLVEREIKARSRTKGPQ